MKKFLIFAALIFCLGGFFRVSSQSSEIPPAEMALSPAIATMGESAPPVLDDIFAPTVSEEDVALLALVTMAEAEGECEEGQRLVIDTILNRVDDPHFPDTIYDVVYQPHQFSSMWNGRADRCFVKNDILRLVKEELANRTNYDVVFFHAGRYSKFGAPMFQVEHHYFSKYA